MSNIIDKIQVSGVTYDIQGSGGGGITIDPTLDSGSTNPVANSAITTALDAKVNVADNEVSGLTIAETAFYGVRYDYGRITDLYVKLANENTTGNGTFYLYYHTSSSSNSWFGVSWVGIEGVLTSATVTNSSAVTATLEDGICHLSFDEGYSFSYIWKDYTETFDFWFYTDYNGGQSARVIEGSVSQAISDSYKEIKNVLVAKVNVADNAVPTKTIMYAYDAGDTSDKYPYNNGLRINQFFVSYSRSSSRAYANAWGYLRITNNGSPTNQINLIVNASNYQITSVVSTSDDFTYALEGGKVNITLPDGYYVLSFSQSPNFQISYGKYTIYGGQSANALQNTDDVIQNIYNEVPKRFLTGGSISSDSNYLYTNLYDNNGSGNSSTIPLGTSIKGEGNRLDVYFNGQTIHQKILNTGNGNYCNVPNPPAWNYTDDLDEVIIHFNSGYTGSNTSYTIQVQTIEPNTNTHNDNLYYDVANHTLDASSANFVTATTVGDDYTYLIKPKQEYSSYKIARIRENNWCNICGIDNQWKEEYIITGVTTPSYSYQAQEIIDDLYSKVGSGITSGEVQTMIDESVSGKVDTSVYTAYTAATDTALASKQTTLTAGTNITIVDNVISATGGGSVTVDTELDSGSTNPVQNKVIYNKIDEVEQVTAAALNNINDRLSEDEEVTAAGLNALNDNFGGLKLVKLTEAEYNALATKDSSTLYIIVN